MKNFTVLKVSALLRSMKYSLSHNDLAQYSKELASVLVGTQLQEVRVGEDFVGLGCWSHSQRRLWWMWVDLNPAAPTVVLLPAPPKAQPKAKKPLNLFLNAHGLRKMITSIVVEPVKGRVLDIYLSETVIELRLFPKGHNVICSSEGKRVGFCKIEQLPANQTQHQTENQTQEAQDLAIAQSFDHHKFAEEWLNSQKKVTPQKSDRNEKTIEKKQRALEKMRQDLVEKQDGTWAQLGEHLKIYGYQNLHAPLVDLSKIDLSKPVAYNIEFCFQKSKDNQRKVAGALERIEKIKQEIEALKSSDKISVDKNSGSIRQSMC